MWREVQRPAEAPKPARIPGMSGRELSERVRDVRPDIGVLFVDGNTDDAVLRGGIAHGDMDILANPSRQPIWRCAFANS